MGEILERCLSEDPAQRPHDASEVARYLDGAAEAIDRFEPQDVLADRFVVRSRHDSGGLTIVYRMFDNITNKEYGGKFIHPEFSHLLDPNQEWALLERVPPQKNVARPTFVMSMERLCRGDKVITHKASFLLTRWIEGQSLDHYLDQALPETGILQIGADVLSGIAHLHGHDILHPDIKPENILLRKDGSAVILDFNVSTHGEVGKLTLLGTPDYRAPEVSTSGWSKAADLYAAGVCLVELIAGKRLGDKAGSWLSEHGDSVHLGLRVALGQLVSSDPTKRGEASG